MILFRGGNLLWEEAAVVLAVAVPAAVLAEATPVEEEVLAAVPAVVLVAAVPAVLAGVSRSAILFMAVDFIAAFTARLGFL